MALTIIRTGHWLYGGSVPMPVDIIGLDYDWYYESSSKGAGILEDDDRPIPLDSSGLIYYARFRKAGETAEPTWVDTVGDATPEDAMLAAESKIPAGIIWE
jgi:hypothetical protein